MRCPNCRSTNDDDAHFCTSSGTALVSAPAEPALRSAESVPGTPAATFGLWLFGLIIGVPLFGLAVSTGIRFHFDTELRAAAIKQVPDVDAANIAALTVARLCKTPDADLADLCQTDTNLAIMRTASISSLVIGLGLLSLITLAGVAAQWNRTLLLLLFRPGLYLTAATITGLILTHAIIAIAAIYYGESALVNRVHFGIIFAIGLAAIGGVLSIAVSAFGVVKKAETIAIGKVVSREEATGLWDQIDSVAQKLGALRPDHIVIGLDPTFFVTEADVVTLSGRVTGRTLFCSLPLARILRMQEFVAIVGHELGHFRGEDASLASASIQPIVEPQRQSSRSIQLAARVWAPSSYCRPFLCLASSSNALLWPKVGIAGHANCSPDKAGAEASSLRAMATALVKVHAFAGVWAGFEQASMEALQKGKVYINASTAFAEAVANTANRATLEGVADAHTSHPTDSHPSLAVRLESLNLDLASVAADSLNVKPVKSAASLIQDAEAREEDLSEAYQLLLARRFGIETNSQDQSGEA